MMLYNTTLRACILALASMLFLLHTEHYHGYALEESINTEENQDTAFMTKSKTSVYKILKVILYYMGLSKARVAYEREQHDKMI